MDKELQALIEDCKESLLDAAQNPQNPWKLFTLANVSADGSPRSRYVVLRDVSFSHKAEVIFFTDKRSEKVEDLISKPQASLCFFDGESGLQLVMNSKVEVHHNDAVAQKFWQKTSWTSLQCYYMKENPGEAIQAPFILEPKDLTEEQAYSFFTVVKCTIESWDILRLKKTGNQRAFCFFDVKGNRLKADWLAP